MHGEDGIRSVDRSRGHGDGDEGQVTDGAPSAGFPTATPQDLCTHQLGPKFVTRGSTLDFVSFLLVSFGSYAETSGTALRVSQIQAPAVGRHLWLSLLHI